MAKHTSQKKRRTFYREHEAGDTYREIAAKYGISKECVRYWCRRQRDGGSCRTVYQRPATGILSGFDPKVRYGILRLRLQHPGWGPSRIQYHLGQQPNLRDKAPPSAASIGRYLHQWSCFQRRARVIPPPRERPNPPRAVHQRWQVDFKEKIHLADGTVHLYTAYDPVGAACIGARLFRTADHSQCPRIRLQDVQAFLRTCFARWGTLPDEIQTDGETVLTGKPCQESFPSRFTLWLKGLGIEHLVTRPAKPTDNAEVERCHRTIFDYAIVGHETATVDQVQLCLNKAVDELALELPSRAKDCRGRPPAVAHPDLCQPKYPFRAEHELARFDLQRVDHYLATLTWPRQVGCDGRVRLGTERYYVGTAYAHRHILVRFDPMDRYFVFQDSKNPKEELRRLPAKGLQVEDLTGIVAWPFGPGVQQLPLQLCFAKG